MADSIQATPPVAPVNANITIQPVATAAPNNNQEQLTQNPLANLANGTTVEGFVVNRDAQNNPILRTPIGDLQVASDIFLKTGSEVTIKVDTSVPSLAKILSVDGLSPQDYNAQSARGITEDTITTISIQPLLNTSAAPPASTSNLPAGAPILQAIILQPQEQPPAAPLLMSALASAQSGPASVMAQLSQLSAGTPIRLALLDIKLPAMPISLSSLPDSKSLDSFLPPQFQVQQTIRQTEGQPQVAGYKPVTNQQPVASQAQPIGSEEIFAGISEAAANPVQTGLQLQQQILTATLETELPETVVAQTPVARPSDATTAPTAPITTAPAPQTIASQVIPAAADTSIPRNEPATQSPTAFIAPAPLTQAPAIAQATPSVSTTAPAQPQLNQPTAPNQLVANVIGHDADGANILQTPFASLKVYTPQPLPTGTTLLVQADLQTAQAAQSQTAPGVTPQNPIVSITPVQSVAQHLTGELSAFSDALSWLQGNQPDVAQDMLAKLPTIANNLASTMIAYIAGIKSGDVADIIGKRAVRMLEASAPEVLSRLRQSVDTMQTNLIDSPLPHWSVIPLPLWFGQELQQLQMYISKEPPEKQQNQGEQSRGHRFVLEVGLSHIGEMQFDGFVRERQPAKSFDLMVRTAAALPNDVSQGIRSIFENSMQITGMQGQVIFQHGRQHFVKPLAEAPGATFDGGANTILA